MQQPPLLPEIVLGRVINMAWRNGLSILLVAGLSALMSATQGGAFDAIVALLAAGAGAMEVHGSGLLRHGEKTGLGWAARGELLLLGVILFYCGFRLVHPDLESWRLGFRRSLEVFPWMTERWNELQQQGITEDQYLRLMAQTSLIAFAAVSLIYQGGMVLYYRRRQAAIDAALAEE